MNISDIPNVGFSENTEPMDEHLMELLKQAYTGKITCRMAIAKFETIEPFSDYEPDISDQDRIHFVTQTNKSSPPPLYVYARDGKLIMSDDYASYHMYKEYELPEAVCVVIGDTPEIAGVAYKSEPFILPPPTIEEIQEK